jgi:hypothetical protein
VLPDYPSLKQELHGALNKILRARFQAHSQVLNEVPRGRVFEGTGTQIQRASGEVEDSDDLSASGTLTLKTEDLPKLTFEKVVEKLDEVAQEMAAEATTKFFQSLEAATARTGNVVDAGGRPLSAEAIIEVLEKIYIDCDDDGNLELPTIVIHPKQADALRAAEEELDRDPQLKRRHEEALEAKREEWRVREASRKLVG